MCADVDCAWRSQVQYPGALGAMSLDLQVRCSTL